MKPLKLKQNKHYKIERFKDSSWVRAYHKKEMIGLCAEMDVAYQVIFQHINNDGSCDRLSIGDFK